MLIEEKILIEENEIKPNKYVANVVLFSFLAMVFVEIINELGMFHVGKTKMRFSCLIVAICVAIVQLIARNKKISCRPRTKYYVLFFVLIETLVVTCVISQWTELVFALLIILGLQYHNKSITYFSLSCTAIIAFISSPVSVWLNLNQLDFYDFLVRTTGYKIETLAVNEDFNKLTYIWGVIKYISVPRCLIILSMGMVLIYTTNLVSSNIKGRIDAIYHSTTDIMTGLFNRFSFESKVSEYTIRRPKNLICIYGDADELHEINNEYGHAAGDNLLKECSRQMQDNFGALTYRIGGDEFLSFVESDNVDEIMLKIENIQMELSNLKYHVSLGVSCLQENETIDDLVKSAEKKMFDAKNEYYTNKVRRLN